MTDYNQQNQGKKEIAANSEGNDKEKYKHFRMLLYIYIKTVFLNYLKDKEAGRDCYRFLREPEYREAGGITEEAFCDGWHPHLYDSIRQKMEQNPMLQSWYVLAHFLNPKQLNLLIGCIKNYMQYV